MPADRTQRPCSLCGTAFVVSLKSQRTRCGPCSRRKATNYYERPDPAACMDCGGSGLGWWRSRSGYEHSGSVFRRCQPCYLAYCRARYRRYQARKGLTVRTQTAARGDRNARRSRVCWVCSAPYQVGDLDRSLRFCSAACRASALKDRYRRKNARRRRALKGIPYTLHGIGERDGWRCHLCGRRVNRKLSGQQPMGPTVDHLIPLRDGGIDSIENVALAHRRCNCARQAGGTVQLRLVG